jgi:putative oxidoreductase
VLRAAAHLAGPRCSITDTRILFWPKDAIIGAVGRAIVPGYAGIAPGSLPWWGGVIELVCGTLIVLGLFTRPAAFLASGEMAVAYFVAHAPRNFFPLLNDGRPAVAFCFVFLYLAVAGGGAWSLDRLIAERGGRSPRWIYP